MSNSTKKSLSDTQMRTELVYRLTRAARKRGYQGRLGVIQYAFRSFRNYVLNLLAVHLPPIGLVITLHRARGVRIGKNVFIGEEVFIDNLYPEMIEIGDGTFLAARCIILAHMRDLTNYQKGMWIGNCPHVAKPVRIGKGVHVGMGTIVLPGVNIGDGAIIGSGAVVTTNIPRYAVAVGVPAKVLKEIP